MFRIGFGYDVHQLVENRKLVLGGIEIPFHKGTLGHSDGDALIHAICDALLGALALGDIGQHFPDTSSEFKDIDSKILLNRTISLIREKGWEISNIDSTICLEKPKLRDYIPFMQSTLAGVLGISEGQVSVKATTTEKMGFVGTGEGVAAYATVLIGNSE
jgi:2-C-methyl-D-erythritol 2,4-cyclodiphosphate synthase